MSPLASPHTAAVKRAIGQFADHTVVADLLFLESWERTPVMTPGAALRASQIRRANPELFEQIRSELDSARRAER